ncbi:type I polyketide synthase [Shewanella psychromarinicola]|uniref:SDR family NAD(P)-dependent oxidoreductase n=1 Tax=Shewanella psychromarinicola TaxID=2487742 RepID=A0A3N4E9B0_9GAMM|nr:type I polyketide synthase [Shewanella psychromarinicola]AZG36950.1 SDR family NAD(P)-dependent oxidoreductase [Shewanella psychromarinicola]MCL1082478.1 SDR family NAD(P)-dependent oxidoreductase [Shewanella psychromarinicola]RPA34805.1 SDR family NAD(P)-dependent oxidoreductase [Shewanella psychromarinicola]
MSQSSNIDKRLNKRLKDMPVAIVGMASIFANSRYLNKFWDLISEKIDAIIDVPETHWNAEDYYNADKSMADKTYCKRGGFLPEVDFNPMEFGLPPNILELTDTSQLLSLVVAKEVLADAGIDAQYDTDRIGITLGVGGGQKLNHSLSGRLQYPILKKVFKNSGLSDEDTDMLIKKFQDQYIHWEENSFPGSLGNVIAGRIANRFDLGGMNCVVDAACAGSLAAMRMAITELVEGRSDMMLTGGVCTDNSPSMYMSFSKTPAFTTNDTIQPFDIDSKGMMIGEGIGMMALKRLDDAERDGDRIYAVIKGVGSSSDGKFKSIYAPRPEGQAKALRRAYDDAGFAPNTVGLIEAHGTGTAAGDVAEFNGLKSVFTEDNDTQQHIALGSVKSQVGHTKSTAGTAGVIKVALALHHKVLPPTINVSKPNPKLNIQDSPFYLNTETRPWLPRADNTPRRAGISAFGFGGTNFHIVLEEYRQEHVRGDKYRQRSVPQTLLIHGQNKAALQAQLTALQAEVNGVDTTQQNRQEIVLADLGKRFALNTIAPNAARIGLVVASLADLTVQLTQAQAQLSSNTADSWQLPSGTSYRAQALIHPESASHKVAALFAGQGAQYLNMGADLACLYPEMRQQLMQADKVFAQHKQTQLSQVMYPNPAFEADDIAAQHAALTNTANAQSAIGAVSMGQYALLTQAGFTADMVAGHSFGELSALCAAGVISQADYYQLAFARGQAMAATPKDQDAGVMYAIIVPAQSVEQGTEQVEKCISAFEGVKVANYNAPTQLVIAGPTASCTLAAQAITTELGFKAIALPVSGAFHTPLVAHAQQPFAAAIGKVKFAKPKLSLYANGTGKAYPNDPKAIKAALTDHMLQSVRFSEQLTAMYDAGARVFVEFGPKNILQKLVEATLGNKAEPVSVVSLNPNPKGSSDTQLRQAACQLAVLGMTLTEVDPYQAPIAELAKVSPMNVKLTASNYISPNTQAKMNKSLQTGTVTSQTVEVPVEKVVEKIVEKEVIKTEYIEVPATSAPASAVAAPLAAAAPIAKAQPVRSNVSASADSIGAFFAAQQQTAELHQQFLAIPQQYGDTFVHLMTAQAQMASSGLAIPESLQRSMEMFHQHQAQTLQSHTQFLTLQAQASQAALAMLQGQTPAAMPASVSAASVQPAFVQSNHIAQAAIPSPVVAPVAPASAQVQTAQAAQAVQSQPTASIPVQAPVAQQVSSAAVSVPTAGLTQQQVLDTMLNVVADKTGYPTEMLELGMDMEADLGIDSIKRVEILGTVQEELPGLPELSPEDLAECRTLGEIVSYMQTKLPAANAVAVASTGSTSVETAAPASTDLTAENVQRTMLNVVADKTGYPTEMLELGMDMEADLGIDSIKRVEILGTVQDELPGLPELSPEDLAECRTLGEIVSYMQTKLPAASTVAPASIASAPAAGLNAESVQRTMLAVVADKTGYPTEMLELGMDMEADLGIDSIKRVEILGTVQDELPGLPELNPEDLAECRTLGEIVSYMQTKLPAASTVAPVATVSSSAPATTGLSADTVLSTMMSVVADKTGYPAEMLELSMDMEADLGIDSIKRVEILGTVQDELPGLPELNPEDLAECRTLGEIVSYMQTKLPAANTVTAASTGSTSVTAGSITAAPESTSLSAENVQRTMLSVVADKTGYPAEMLELSMDMEADLGIDSIKRVEILGTVQDELPGLPELNPEDLAECRTLGEIVSYMQTKLPAAGIVAEVVTPALSANKLELDTTTLPPHSEVALKKLPATDKLLDCFSTATCIVITDDGHNAGLLAEKLNAKGLTVAVIRHPQTISVAHSPLSSDIKSYTLNSIDDAQIAKVIADIKADIGAEQAIAGFVHLQPQATANSSELMSCTVAAKAAVDNAFLWAKHLHPEFAKPTSSRLCYFTVSRLDGGFGYLDNSQLATAELNQAALSGLSKTLSHEWPQVFCRALDIANNLDASAFADAIVAELFDIDGANASEDRINEVGISQQGRVTLVAANASEQFAPATLDSNDTILVTGGAKGVTFECALTLAKQCQSHFVLAGRSQHFASDLPVWAQGKQASELKAAAIAYIQSQGNKPTPKQIDALVWPISSSLEIDRALAAFGKVGASAQYVSMDVSDATAVAASLKNLTNAKGDSLTINGIIHGAGVLADKHIQDKTLDELNRVYHTKVTGLASILNALDPQQIKLIALFSSAAAFYGNSGQSDYAMSNEILNKTALKLAHTLPQAKVMSFNWGPWDGGMVSSALKKMFVERGVYVIPLQTGAELFAHSLLSQQGAQLLIGSDMQGSSEQDNAAKKPNADALLIAKGSLKFATKAFTTKTSETKTPATDIISQTVTRVLTPAEMPFVSDHCIAGNPVLPTVCAMQWMRDAAEILCHVPVSIAEYKLLKGVIFDTNEPHLLQLELSQTEAEISAQISSRLLNEPSAAMKPQYQATLVINSAILATEITKPAIDTASLTKWSHMVPLNSGAELYQNGTLFHGPRLQGINQVLAFDDAQLLCRVQLPQINAADCQGFIPSSALGGSQIFAEDLLLQAMLVWARLKYGAASLPSSTGECVTAWPFANGDKGYIQLNVVKHSGRMLIANVSLYHQDGRLSCQMLNAKVTISKSLNGAFIAHQAAGAELSHHSKETV